MNTIYTYGYGSHPVDEIAAYLTATHAILLDIRYRPWSRHVGWSGDALRRRFGAQYRGLSCLGNRNYQGGPILLDAPLVALPIVRDLLGERPVILLCVCWNVTTCHRKVAADWLAERLDAPIEHLPGKFARWPRPRVAASTTART